MCQLFSFTQNLADLSYLKIIDLGDSQLQLEWLAHFLFSELFEWEFNVGDEGFNHGDVFVKGSDGYIMLEELDAALHGKFNEQNLVILLVVIGHLFQFC